MSENKSIIIKKIKKSGSGHHGGAWKVAYADFVTAMMAFFLLLWLLSSQPSPKLKGVADYFRPTIGLGEMKGIGFDPASNPEEKNKEQNKKASDNVVFGSEYKGTIIALPENTNNNQDIEAKNFSSLAKDLYKAIQDNPNTQLMKDSVQIDETPEGIRIQLLDKDKRPMFIPGTYKLEDYTKKTLVLIAKYIKFIPNYISIAGHTSTDPISNPDSVDNYELSAKRANVTRLFLINQAGLDKSQVARIEGKADQEPLDIQNPENLSNIRMSITLLKNSILPYQKQTAPDKALYDNTNDGK